MATSTGTPSRIQLKGNAGNYEEYLAAGVIRPGHLLRINVDGYVIPHDQERGQAERMFALEDALQGNGIETNYASGERVFCYLAAPGEQIYGWLAFGYSVVKGDFLGSDGNGNFMPVAESGGSTLQRDSLAVALETIDNNDSGDNNTRIKVRVL